MPKVVEPTFIAYDLQVTSYEAFADRRLGDGMLGRALEGCRTGAIEHMVYWRGCWKAANWYAHERQWKPKQKNANKRNGHKSKVKETSISMSVPAKRTGVVGSLVGIICYPISRRKKSCSM
ncbi:hypothetical protein BDQ17DRAFT_1335516 [Cyathus striatus]|nr:hypothetical protein BDQ17DRAFT_1335516 [Cyathus striatus]